MRSLKILTGRSKASPDTYFSFIFIALAIRILISLIPPYKIDMDGYAAWSLYLADNGSAGLYDTFHVVYAPFYQYFLWLSGLIATLFNMTKPVLIYLLKMWPLLFECVGAWLMFKISERADRRGAGIAAAILYLLNPAVFMNTSVWGQFDAVPATMILGTVYLFELKWKNAGALLFLAAVLTKPQSGLLLPIVLYLYFRDFRADRKSLLRFGAGIVSGIALYLAIVLPFYQPTSTAGVTVPAVLDPFYWLFDLYSRSLMDYPYASANAMNFWMLVGGQIREDTLNFAGLTYLLWGNIMLVLSVIYVFYLIIKARGSLESIIYSSGLILFSAFMWMTKMHERYMLPAIIFLLLSAAFSRRHVFVAAGASACVFLNQLIIYLMSFREEYWLPRWNPASLAIAGLTFAIYIVAMRNGYIAFASDKKKVIIT
jgi:Gpi18-like mannosyltransferase